MELHYQEKLEKAENTISLNGFTESKKVLKYFKDKYNPTKLFNFYNGFANTYSNCIDKKEKTFSKILNEVYGLPRVKCHEIMFGNDELKENKDRIEYLKTILDELNIKYYGDKNVKET